MVNMRFLAQFPGKNQKEGRSITSDWEDLCHPNPWRVEVFFHLYRKTASRE